MTTIAQPDTLDGLADAVRSAPAVALHGGRTKASLIPQRDGAVAIDTTALAGVTEYEPTEFTFTALAGTRLAAIDAMLAEHGQYLPFDPPLIEAGATLGGCVASGLSGPGRLRYGGIRDFVLGVRFVDGTGALRYAGAKTVKNVAGFDVPKLVVGSAGRLAAIAELTFKVFPRPTATSTACFDHDSLTDAVATISRLTRAGWDLDLLDLEPSGHLILRVAGSPDSTTPLMQRITQTIGPSSPAPTYWDEYWEPIMDLSFIPDGMKAVRVATTPSDLVALDGRLEVAGAIRRYSVAGNTTWIGWPNDRPLDEIEFPGLVLRAPTPTPARFGPDPARPFYDRIKQVFDPDNRFGDW